MNVRGIKFLRALGLPGPNKERIGTQEEISRLNLDWLYFGAPCDITLVGFDARLPINSPSVLETDVRDYNIQRRHYQRTLKELSLELSKKGVPEDVQRFMAHPTYTSQQIVSCGKMFFSDDTELGKLVIDARSSLRKHHRDFDPEATYLCPVVGGRIFRSQAKLTGLVDLLDHVRVSIMVRDIYRIPGSPQLDFEVQSDGSIFYHDLNLNDSRAYDIGSEILAA